MLRAAVVEDAAFVFELVNSQGWIEYIGDRGVKSLDDARIYIRQHFIKSYQLNGHGLLVITLKDSSHPIGLCGLLKRTYLDAPDLGFAILKEYEGKGYVFEASKMVIEHGFSNLGLNKIHATTIEYNQRSRKLLTKLGFEHIVQEKPPESKTDSLLFTLSQAP